MVSLQDHALLPDGSTLSLSTVLWQPPDEFGVAQIVLHRPEKMNAFTSAMGSELSQLCDAVSSCDAVRVVIISGAGTGFCAGADLSPSEGKQDGFDVANAGGLLTSTGLPFEFTHRDAGGALALALLRCRKPIIGAIHGRAVGIGITMTLSFDVRLATEDAKIGFVFARRGIVPEACSSKLLADIVGRGKAMEWCLTGNVFPAKEAPELFNYLYTTEAQLKANAYRMAKTIATKTSPAAVAMSKALLLSGLGVKELQDAHLCESHALGIAFQGADCREGVAAFFERREPQFKASPWRDLSPVGAMSAWSTLRARL